MVGLLIQLLIVIIVFGLLFHILQRPEIPLGQPWRNIAMLVLVVILIVVLLNMLGVVSVYDWHWRSVG